MNESTFKALIRLLDDDDPEVAHKVEMELRMLGKAGIPRLEHAWETIEDVTIQARIEELICKLQVEQTTHDLKEWRMEGGKDLLEGWLLLTQIQYPTLNLQKYRNEVNRLVNRIWLETNASMNDLEKLVVVNKLLYTSERFTSNHKEPDKAENYHFSTLIDTRKGNSLSLSALYFLLAQRLDIPLQVVNFKGYFALRHYQHSSHFYIDAFNKGMFFTPQQVEQFLKKLQIEHNVYHYKPLTPIYVVLNLLEQLVSTYLSQNQHEKAQLYQNLAKDIEVTFE